MAISPTECRRLTPGEEARVTQIEAEWDQVLRDYDWTQGTHRIDLSPEVNTRMRRALIDRYEEVGWTVTYCPATDQRDVDSLLFHDYDPAERARSETFS